MLSQNAKAKNTYASGITLKFFFCLAARKTLDVPSSAVSVISAGFSMMVTYIFPCCRCGLVKIQLFARHGQTRGTLSTSMADNLGSPHSSDCNHSLHRSSRIYIGKMRRGKMSLLIYHWPLAVEYPLVGTAHRK